MDKVGFAGNAPVIDLDGIKPTSTPLCLTHKGLVYIQGDGQLFLSEPSMGPNIAEQLREDPVLWPVDAFPCHRSTL